MSKKIPTWQQAERLATPWQAVQRSLPSFYFTPPAMHPGGGPDSSAESGARKAAQWRAANPPTRFYDGFKP